MTCSTGRTDEVSGEGVDAELERLIPSSEEEEDCENDHDGSNQKLEAERQPDGWWQVLHRYDERPVCIERDLDTCRVRDGREEVYTVVFCGDCVASFGQAEVRFALGSRREVAISAAVGLPSTRDQNTGSDYWAPATVLHYYGQPEELSC